MFPRFYLRESFAVKKFFCVGKALPALSLIYRSGAPILPLAEAKFGLANARLPPYN
jgi:hypothetical protein